MQSLGVIETVAHPTEWVSPIIVVPKQNGTVRICVDYIDHVSDPSGRFRFARLPFGLNWGSEVFIKQCKQFWNELQAFNTSVTGNIDDILIWRNTKESHEARLRQVLDRCRQRGLHASQCLEVSFSCLSSKVLRSLYHSRRTTC